MDWPDESKFARVLAESLAEPFWNTNQIVDGKSKLMLDEYLIRHAPRVEIDERTMGFFSLSTYLDSLSGLKDNDKQEILQRFVSFTFQEDMQTSKAHYDTLLLYDRHVNLGKTLLTTKTDRIINELFEASDKLKNKEDMSSDIKSNIDSTVLQIQLLDIEKIRSFKEHKEFKENMTVEYEQFEQGQNEILFQAIKAQYKVAILGIIQIANAYRNKEGPNAGYRIGLPRQS